MSATGAANSVGGYPYWTEATKNDGKGGHMSLYWSKDVEISSVVSGKPGWYTIHCSAPDGTHWETVIVHVKTMAKAQKIAEVTMKFIQLERGK